MLHAPTRIYQEYPSLATKWLQIIASEPQYQCLPFYFTCPEGNNEYIGDEVIEETEKEDSAIGEENGKYCVQERISLYFKNEPA